MLNKLLVDKIKNGTPFCEPQAIHGLFSWAELEKILNITPLINNNRFHIINNAKYSWNPSFWQSDLNSYPTEIIKEELKHYVCYITDASRQNKLILRVEKY
jgi:hypothetical protein